MHWRVTFIENIRIVRNIIDFHKGPQFAGVISFWDQQFALWGCSLNVFVIAIVSHRLVKSFWSGGQTKFCWGINKNWTRCEHKFGQSIIFFERSKKLIKGSKNLTEGPKNWSGVKFKGGVSWVQIFTTHDFSRAITIHIYLNFAGLFSYYHSLPKAQIIQFYITNVSFQKYLHDGF